MKTSVILLLTLLVLAGCGSDDSGTNPPATPPEDWSFPADSTGFSATLYAARETVAVGANFDVLFVLYNVDSLFGATAELAYAPDTVEVLQVIAGPHFSPAGDILTVSNIEPASARVSFGVTFKRGTHPSGTSGSGAVMKLKCRGKAAGRAAFTFVPSKLLLQKEDGTPIPGFGSLSRENLTVIVQ